MKESKEHKTGSAGHAEPRISFFEEQAQRRRHAKWWALLTAVLGLGMAWSFAFLFVLAVVFYTVLLSGLLPRPLERMFDQATAHSGGVATIAIVAGCFMVTLWIFVQRIFDRDSSVGFLQRIGARPPNLLDLEEKQLVNIAEEMAIAATAPRPAVMLFDGNAINAAAIGERPDTAVLVISRELLNTLNRDETQGVLGHLVASVTNGDLRLVGAMLRTFYLMGLSVTLLDLPFSRRSRQAIVSVFKYVTTAPAAGSPASGTDAGGVGEALTTCLQPEGLVSLSTFMQKFIGTENNFRSVVGALLLFPLLPLIMLRLAAGIVYGLASLFILGPLVALLLRSRRRLADATAVQLTRNPDGLGAALVHLYSIGHVVPQAGWSEMAFIIGHEAAGARQFDRFENRISELRLSASDFKTRIRGTANAVAALEAPTAKTESAAARHNFIFGFHPSLGSRIVQLNRMGATIPWTERKDYSGWIIAVMIGLAIGFVFLLYLGSQRSGS